MSINFPLLMLMALEAIFPSTFYTNNTNLREKDYFNRTPSGKQIKSHITARFNSNLLGLIEGWHRYVFDIPASYRQQAPPFEVSAFPLQTMSHHVKIMSHQTNKT
jgi:hypothetical protein